MNAPLHLSHKPIVAVNDYDNIDGMYASNSDAKALSIGRAQYNLSHISLKVWRHTGNKWSRESEELPVHRVLDLCILIVTSIKKSNALNCSLNPEVVSDGSLQDVVNYYKDHQKILDPA